ncbi:hypothetical protein HD597_004285 [Nonomuraea thailandensis]|uniref:Lipoprotein n=1 Tax=Nonomuraea thailandensis TaxID=1188745 RepID=A0A9X2K2N4_9ACTN|nr:hypothetical protein [Nonomuraea thailandensis]MCP2357265.1 hypothetical protein [Nonomuraea thailandensis]
MNTISKTALALAAAAVLSGCGSDPGPAGKAASPPTEPAATAQEKRHRFESVKADCMKQKGFRYIAHVPREELVTDEERRRRAGDYEALKAQRAKYGFGVFAVYVHPKGPDSPDSMPDLSGADPNGDVWTKLSPAQRKSYWKAVNACVAVAAKQVLGKDVKSDTDLFDQLAAASDRAVRREIDGDAELVELASSMATCLTGKGYEVSATMPSELSQRGRIAFLDQEDEIGRRQREDVADVPPPVKKGEVERTFGATLTPAEARPHLAREIQAALDDLECGRDFYRVYTPKSEAIAQRIAAEYGS